MSTKAQLFGRLRKLVMACTDGNYSDSDYRQAACLQSPAQQFLVLQVTSTLIKVRGPHEQTPPVLVNKVLGQDIGQNEF